MSEQDSQGRTWLCSVVFLDIASFTGRPVAQQIEIKQHLQDITTDAVRQTPAQDRIMIDTGDGAALCFFGDPEDALFAALNIRAAVISDAVALSAPYELRIGINLGPVKVVRSISGQRNPLGDGINNAQRVMTFAQPNQILVGRSFYEVVACLSQEYAHIFHHLGVRHDKHVKEHDVYEVRLHDEVPAIARPAVAADVATGAWEGATLAQVGTRLAAYVGPMARVLVNRAAQTATGLDDLYRMLAASIEREADRQAFLSERVASGAPADLAAASAAAGGSTTGGGATATRWDPVRLAQLSRCLAQYIGPLAGMLVNKAAREVGSEEALIARLAAELDKDAERRAFLDAIRSRVPETE